MVKQAEQFAEADKKKMEVVEAHNQAETAIHTVKKSLDELGDKVTQEERGKVEAAISDLEAANKTDDVSDIRAKLDALMKVMGPISERIYKEASQQQGAPGAESQAGQQASKDAQGDFVDADYKIVDDE